MPDGLREKPATGVTTKPPAVKPPAQAISDRFVKSPSTADAMRPKGLSPDALLKAAKGYPSLANQIKLKTVAKLSGRAGFAILAPMEGYSFKLGGGISKGPGYWMSASFKSEYFGMAGTFGTGLTSLALSLGPEAVRFEGEFGIRKGEKFAKMNPSLSLGNFGVSIPVSVTEKSLNVGVGITKGPVSLGINYANEKEGGNAVTATFTVKNF